MKKEIKRAERPQTKSRARYICPPKLKEAIELYNLAPPHAALKSRDELQTEAKEAAERQGIETTERANFVDNYLERTVLEECKNYPKLTEFIANRVIFGLPGGAADTYFDFLHFRDVMNNFLQLGNEYRDTKIIKKFYLPISATLICTISEKGLFQVNQSSFGYSSIINALADVEAERLRNCEICSGIFWAKREDSETCSPRCFGILRTRRYRTLTNEEKAQRKAQRELNKQNKIRLKNGKENMSDGTL